MLKNKFNSGNTPLFKIDIISKILIYLIYILKMKARILSVLGKIENQNLF